MNNPRKGQMEVAKHVLRYLKGTKDVGITYSKQADEKIATRLFGYVDADHASDLDDRKSVVLLRALAQQWSRQLVEPQD